MKKLHALSIFIFGGFLSLGNLPFINPIREDVLQVASYFYHNGGSIYYEVKGKGFPLVFVHGGNMDNRIWDDQVNIFAKRNLVIRYDIRGFGKSDRPKQPYSHVEDLFSLLNHLHVNKAVLVGLSLGSRIIIDFCLIHPEIVEALICAGPGLSGFSFPQESNKRIWKIIEAARDEGSEKAAAMWLDDPYMKPAMENLRIREKIRRIVFENAHVWLSNPLLERPIKPPALEQMAALKTPLVIIVGKRDVEEIHAVANLLASSVSGARKVIIPGAGHIVNMENPLEFNEVVLGFIKSIQKEFYR